MTTYVYSELAYNVNWESTEQHADFLAEVDQIADAEYVARLLSVMNKPSQFVGRVCDFKSAVEHWKQWDQWQLENVEEGEAIPQPADPKKRGRPAAHSKQAIDKAADAWHTAVAQRRQAKLDWAAWRKAEIAKIEEKYKTTLIDWDNFVAAAREELSRVQNN